MSVIDRITVDPTVCGGRPCIRGIRIRVKDVLDLLAAGLDPQSGHPQGAIPIWSPTTSRLYLEFAARQNDHPVLRRA